MTTIRNALILALFAMALSASGCGGDPANSNAAANANTTQANSNSTKTNVEELGMLINVPYESEEVFWRDDRQQKSSSLCCDFLNPRRAA